MSEWGAIDTDGNMLDAEKAVLACLVHGANGLHANPPALFARVAECVSPVDFQSDLYRRAFRAISDGSAGQDESWLAALEADPFVRDLVLDIVKSCYANPELGAYYAKLVRTQAEHRRWMSSLSLLAEQGKALRPQVPDEVDVWQARVEHELRNLVAVSGDESHLADGAALADEITNPSDEPDGLMFGIPGLDALTEGLRPGNYCVLAGRTSTGKSTLAAQIAGNVAASGRSVLFATAEMHPKQIVERFLCLIGGVSLWDLHHLKETSQDTQQRVEDAKVRWKTMPLKILKVVNGSVDSIRNAIARGSYELVVVDYIQRLRGSGKYRSRYEEVSDISLAIAGMAGAFSVPIIACAQLNREAVGSDKPRIHHLRESGNIEQDADQIMLLSCDADAKGNEIALDCHLAKNRHGATDTVSLLFDRPHFFICQPPGLRVHA